MKKTLSVLTSGLRCLLEKILPRTLWKSSKHQFLKRRPFPHQRLMLESLERRYAPALIDAGTSQLISGLPERGFAGMDDTANGGSVITPPDTQIAVGMDHVLEVVNSEVAIYDKTGMPKGVPISLRDFFNNATDNNAASAPFEKIAATAKMSDPVTTYDELSGRFFVAALEKGRADGITYLVFAISKGADPTMERGRSLTLQVSSFFCLALQETG